MRILVNNAAVAITKPFGQITEADLDLSFAVNLKGVFYGLQLAWEHLADGDGSSRDARLTAARSTGCEPGGPCIGKKRPGRAGRPSHGRMCQSSVMQDDILSGQGSGSLAVVSFPERVDGSNADSLQDKLLTVINHGATVVIADMSSTAWCDRAGADAITRVYQRAMVNGAQLRLVVAAEGVRKLMSSDGLDRLVPIYTSLASAVAAGTPDSVVDVVSVQMSPDSAPVSEWAVRYGPGQGNGSGPGAIDPLVLRRLIDALGDGIALTYAGRIMLANRRLAEMFGYRQDELVGREVEALIPTYLRAAHRQRRAAYAREPVSRPMGRRARLVGLAKDGTTVPVAITLSPVPAADGCFILAVIRATAEAGHHEDLTDLVQAAVAEQARHAHDLLDRVVHSVFHVGLSVQAAAGLPAETAGERLTDALQRLDDTVHEIRDHVFGPARGQPPRSKPPGQLPRPGGPRPGIRFTRPTARGH